MQMIGEKNMSDLISRQAAIDAVKKNTFRLTFAEEQNCEGHVAWSANAVYSDVIEGALVELPSEQPEKHTDERTEMHACDLISRQAAIAEITEYGCGDSVYMSVEELKRRIEHLPSAQPEIITCTECKYYDADTEQCNNDKGLRFIDFSNPECMWCPWAERRGE